ncbi:hypothetical protein BsWGS_14929 [Bradybaena similaris]
MQFSCLTLLVVCLQTTQAQFTFEYSQSICQRKWFERMFWAPQGRTVATNTDVLRTHILMGKPVKVSITHGNYQETFIVDNINMNGQVLCGEAVERMSYPIGPDAEYQPIIVCNNGFVSYLNYSAARWDNNVKSKTWQVDTVTFRTRDYSPEHKPVTSRYIDGSTSSKVTDNFRTMAIKSEMRGVMRDRGYSFTMENTHIQSDSAHISGQSLSHISQSYTSNGGITFREQPYHWLSSWETTGRRDSARWTVGGMQSMKHTNDFVALQWFADACWSIVYVHDENGTRIDGVLDVLKFYIKMGHRVRVHFDGYTLEANSVLVSPDDVIVAQTSAEMAIRGGTGLDRTFFNTKTRQIYRLVHTTGMVRSFLYFVENGELSAKTSENHQITWSVDTRPWSPVISMDKYMNFTLGKPIDLLHAVDVSTLRVKLDIQETDARFKGKNSELYLEINNVRIPDFRSTEPEIVGQSLRTVPFYREGDGKNFHLYLYKPVKQYIQVSSTTGLTIASFDMATREYKATADWLVENITWYKDDRIDIQ